MFFHCLIVSGCGADLQPKPNCLSYVWNILKLIINRQTIHPNFSFEHNTSGRLANAENKSAPRLIYPKMKATLYFNYQLYKKKSRLFIKRRLQTSLQAYI